MEEPRIRLTDNTTVLVDPDTFRKLSGYTWYALSDGNAARIRKGGKRVLLHREIMKEPKGLHVGFLNGDLKDCRRQNLFTYPPGKKHVVLREIFSRETNYAAYHENAEVKSLPLIGGGEVFIDADDYERFSKYEWQKFNGCACTVMPNGQMVFLHRELMANPKGMYVSFLDGKRLNCRKSNLFAFLPGKKEAARMEYLWQRTRESGS